MKSAFDYSKEAIPKGGYAPEYIDFLKTIEGKTVSDFIIKRETGPAGAIWRIYPKGEIESIAGLSSQKGVRDYLDKVLKQAKTSAIPKVAPEAAQVAKEPFIYSTGGETPRYWVKAGEPAHPLHGKSFATKKEAEQFLADFKTPEAIPKAESESVNLDWDGLHILSREELLIGAGMNKNLANKKWADLESWMRELLKDSLGKRSKGKAKLEHATKIKWGSPKDIKRAERIVTRGNSQLIPLPDRGSLDRAYYDWISGAAYLGGGNNYRLQDGGRIAHWNKVVKERYGGDFHSNSIFHKDATEWAKSHSTIKLSRLEYEQTHERSSYSQKQDIARQHSKVIQPYDPKVKGWLRDPSFSDIRGIDTLSVSEGTPSITERLRLSRERTRLGGGRTIRITPRRPSLGR